MAHGTTGDKTEVRNWTDRTDRPREAPTGARDAGILRDGERRGDRRQTIGLRIGGRTTMHEASKGPTTPHTAQTGRTHAPPRTTNQGRGVR
eukprot:scaffold14791_cov131-Isochrysis_galbana.AAC.2